MVNDKEMERFLSKSVAENKVAYELTFNEIAKFDNDSLELADMIGDRKKQYQEEKGINSTAGYMELEESCQISADTMKKVISGRLKISRTFLYKFVIGLHMDLDEANTYFEFCGGPLTEKNKEDYICMKAMQDGDDIESLIMQYEKYSSLKIGLRNRRDKK